MISNFYIRFRHIILLLLISSNVYAQSTMLLTLVNNSGFYRENELVTLQKKTIERYLSRPIKFVNVSKAQKQIPVQYVDDNNDGQWDQLVFLYSFTPNEQAELKVSIITKSILSPVKQLAHVRMRKKIGPEAFGPNLSNVTMPLKNPATNFSKEKLPMYLTEGPAWENDKVAFRLYFDVRNNKDIYGKVTSRMMMDTVGANTKMSYHVLSEWGMDVLHVVKSLGAGALALSVPLPAGGDTLIRLGGQNITNTVFQQVADGPFLGRLSLTYDWQINDKPIQLKEEISIWGGQYFYESKVTITGAPAGAKLITGIADFYDNSFGLITEGKAVVGFSYGKQSENKDNLGLAVLVDEKAFERADSINRPNTDVNETYTIAQTIIDKQPLYYRFYAGWERTDRKFETQEGFRSFLNQEALRYSVPIKVSYSRAKK